VRQREHAGEATLDVSGTFAGEAIRLLILFDAQQYRRAARDVRGPDGHGASACAAAIVTTTWATIRPPGHPGDPTGSSHRFRC
jgi:hypothetical protein